MYSPVPPPSASLCRPSVAVARIRSASFSGAVHTEAVSPLKRCHAISTCTPNARAPRKQPKISVTLAPARSCWGGHPRRRANVGWRLPIHKPDCKWMRSSSHPQATPRDKECPACQDAEKRPEELSPSELWWERRMQRLRDAIDKDAYDTIFGWSNDLLRGRPLRPRWFWEDEIKPWSLKGVQEDPIKEFRKRMLDTGKIFDEPLPKKPKTAAETQNTQQSTTTPSRTSPPAADVKSTKKVKIDAEPRQEIPVKKPDQQQKTSSHRIEAHSSWSYKSIDSSGQTTVQTGASMYDPISGRMVPMPQADVPPKAPSGPINSPTAGTASCSGSPFSALEERRIALYEKAENGLVEARDSVKSLRTTHPTDTKPGSLRNTEPPALALTHSRLQAAHFALKGYKYALRSPPAVERNSGASQRASVEDLPQAFDSEKKTSLESSWRSEQRKRDPSAITTAHFRQKEGDEPLKAGAADVAKLAYKALHRRTGVPLTHMSANELGIHRKQLIKAWAKQQEQRAQAQTKSKTAADKRLEQEVEALKTQHTAWESKWTEARPSGKSNTTPAIHEVKSAVASAQTVGGEGDMCPNVAKFCNPNRMYKRKAPHALMAEDPELVHNIKKIYEDAYGTIDENHRQGKLSMTQRSLDQYEVQGIQQEVDKMGQDRAAKRVKTEKPQLDSKVQQNFAASHTQPNAIRNATKFMTDAAEAEAIKAYEAGTARKGLPTALDRHLQSSNASKTSIAPKDSTMISGKAETMAASTTRTSDAEAALFRLVTYDQGSGRVVETPASTHPDKWSTPRLSANTAYEVIRDKKGYQQYLVPLMQKLRRNGYVLYDVARDNKTIVFMRQPSTVHTALPSKSTLFSTASSGGYPSMLHGSATPLDAASGAAKSSSKPKRHDAGPEPSSKAAPMSAIPSRHMINPVDPSLRPRVPQTQTGNFASPTGYVNLEAATSSLPPQHVASSEVKHDSASGPPSSSSPQIQSQNSQKISKQEPVFSGSRRQRSRQRSNPSKSSNSGTSSSGFSLSEILTLVVFCGVTAYLVRDYWEAQRRKMAEEKSRKEKEDERLKSDGMGMRALLWTDQSPTEDDRRFEDFKAAVMDAIKRRHPEVKSEVSKPSADKPSVERTPLEQEDDDVDMRRRTEWVSVPGRQYPVPVWKETKREQMERQMQEKRQRITEALTDVTALSLTLGVVAWVYLRMLGR